MNEIVKLLKIILLVLVSIMLNACAISGAGKEEFITLEQNAKAPVKEGLIVSMSCPEKVYSIMAFILVPLPPIIPVFWANEKISRLYITAPNIGHPEVEITSPTGELVKVMVTAKNESQNHNNPDSKDYFFHINKDCSELNGHMISVSVGEKKTSFYIRYTEGKVKFEWAYLSA